MPDLSDRRALITGARGGIGAAAAKALASCGAAVAVCGRNTGDCEDVVRRINASGGTAHEVPMDMGRLADISVQVDAATELLGGLDIIINNAAVIEPMGYIGQTDPAAFDLACRINLSGPFAVVNAAWSALQQSGGRVLNVLSGAAVHALDGWAAYCSSKAGLHMLTRMIELEGRPQGIRGFGFSPGLVDTGMQSAIRRTKINRVSDIAREQLSPPDRPAEMIAWLVSGEADDMAGEMVDIRDPSIRNRIGWEV